MSFRRFYKKIETDEAIQHIFFVLNLCIVKDECLICFEHIKNSENVVCHECKKPIHMTCIKEWFNVNETRNCPHCRSNWKFEIDITEKPIYIGDYLTGDYSTVPDYKNGDKITIRGSISGPITFTNEYGGTFTITNTGTLTFTDIQLNDIYRQYDNFYSDQ